MFQKQAQSAVTRPAAVERGDPRSRFVPHDLAQLQAMVGRELGPTAPRQITQANIAQFAAVSGDFQWIHTEPARAATGPFGGTIAHGMLTLSLGASMLAELISLEHFNQVLNYGYDRVRYPAPLPVDSELTLTATLETVHPLPNGAQVTILERFDCGGLSKPVCVATALARIITPTATAS
jgi:acyl dehydratase